MGIADPLGIRFVAVGKAVQEVRNIIRGDLIQLGITELVAERFDDGPIGPDGIFFSNGWCGNRSGFLQLWTLSWLTSFSLIWFDFWAKPEVNL